MSIKYAEYVPTNSQYNTYSIIVLPNNISNISDFLEKTLMALELPNMKCNFISIIVLDLEKDSLYCLKDMRPSEEALNESGATMGLDYEKVLLTNNNTNVNLDLKFFEFNDNVKKELIEYLTMIHKNKIAISEKGRDGGKKKN